MGVELSQNVPDVSAQGVLRQAEALCDVIRFHARHQEVEDLSLASGQRGHPLIAARGISRYRSQARQDPGEELGRYPRLAAQHTLDNLYQVLD